MDTKTPPELEITKNLTDVIREQEKNKLPIKHSHEGICEINSILYFLSAVECVQSSFTFFVADKPQNL